MSNLTWRTSQKGNPYIKDGNFLISVFESRRDPGFCWCISSDEDAIKIFSKGAFSKRTEAMTDALRNYTHLVQEADPNEDLPREDDEVSYDDDTPF